MVALEIEGAAWTKGRHTSGVGFMGDCWKYNTAAVRGWKVLRFTYEMIERDFDFARALLELALGAEKE